MKKRLSLFTKISAGIFSMIFLMSVATAGNDTVIDQVVAQIGDEIILLSDIQDQKLKMIQDGQEITNSTECEILEGLLYEKLLISQAEIDSVDVPADMVNYEMDQRLRILAEKFGSMEALEAFYEKSAAQIKAELFERIRKNLMAERMMDIITENVVVTPKEVKEFYESLEESEIPYINSKLSIAQIVIYPQIQDADKIKAKTEIDGYRELIVSGKRSFEGMAILYSQDPGSRLSGGDLGWQTRGTMVPEFEAELFQLEKDSISPVFETQYGYHIIQMMDRKGDNYRCRHILISAEASDNALIKASVTIDSLYKEIKGGRITFEQAAMQFSDDENSKQNGGKIVNPFSQDYLWDLQNINDIDPQMSRIVETLPIGGISSPSLYENYFERKSGLRIVKLLAKSKPHMANLEDDYQLIQMAALNEKKQTVIDNWVNEKIMGTFIRINKGYMSGCTFKYNWLKAIGE